MALRTFRLVATLLVGVVGASFLAPVGPTAAAQPSPTVAIAEIYYNPPGAEEGDEFAKVVNYGSTAVDLSGWTFTDGIAYTFPRSTVLEPGERFVIAATHSGFTATFGRGPDGVFLGSLSNKGETLALTSAAGVVADTVSYDDIAPWPVSADGSGDSLQLVDLSADNHGPKWWLSGAPIPFGGNDPHLGIIFDIGRGFYSGSQTVTLRATDPNATIEYALDNGALTNIYNGPITVADNGDIAVIRARARNGDITSDVVAHTYVFLPDEGVPVNAIWNNDLTRVDGDTRTGIFEIVMPPSNGLQSFAENAGFSLSSGGITDGSTKVYFRSEYGAGTLRADLFSDNYYGIEPVNQFDQLVLRDRHQDLSLQRQAAAMDSLLATGSLAPHGRFVRLYDGGSYVHARFLQERPEGGFMEAYHGGDKSDYASGNGKDRDIAKTYMPVLDASFAQYQAAIDMEQFFDVTLVTWLANNIDTAYNWRWAKALNSDGPADDLMYFFNWDVDVGFGAGDHYSPMTGWPGARYPSVERVWYNANSRVRRMTLSFKIEAVRAMSDQFHCHYVESGGALTADLVLARIDQRYAELVAAGGPEVGRLRPDAHGVWRALMDSWIPGRIDWLISDIKSSDYYPESEPVQGSVSDGLMTLVSPSGGTIYFTLDGSDPRLLDGTVAPAASEYTGPVPLPAGQITVVARAFDDSQSLAIDQWTPVCPDVGLSLKGQGSVAGSLVINEINYNPGIDGAEFVEILNTGAETISLSGMTLAGGVEASLPETTVEPGQFVVVADSATAFADAYGFAADATFSGELSNSGELVELRAADGSVLDSVHYADLGSWPNAPDGTGPSLSLAEPGTDNALPQAWASSLTNGGSPGAANSFVTMPTPRVTSVVSDGNVLTATWSMLDTTGVAGYVVTAIGPGAPEEPVSVAGGDNTQVVVGGVTSENGHCIRVQAVDYDGQVSNRSQWGCVDTTASIGDTDCDRSHTTSDVTHILQFLVGARNEAAGCPLDDVDRDLNIAVADIDSDGVVALADAHKLARCLGPEALLIADCPG